MASRKHCECLSSIKVQVSPCLSLTSQKVGSKIELCLQVVYLGVIIPRSKRAGDERNRRRQSQYTYTLLSWPATQDKDRDHVRTDCRPVRNALQGWGVGGTEESRKHLSTIFLPPLVKCGPIGIQFSSVQFSRSVMSDSLRPRELQHARPSCPSPTPVVHFPSPTRLQICRFFAHS